MTAPWLQYEAYDITFTHNVIHDTQGAGIGVNGGTNIVMANNTMYRVGSRSHVIEVVFGLRSCDGDRAKCTTYLAQGGWGTNVAGREEPIPNKNVVIRDDFVLTRGNRALSLAGANITTTDNQTYTISGLRGTNLAGQYSLRLKAAGTGIADAWATAFARPTTVSWRMSRTVRG